MQRSLRRWIAFAKEDFVVPMPAVTRKSPTVSAHAEAYGAPLIFASTEGDDPLAGSLGARFDHTPCVFHHTLHLRPEFAVSALLEAAQRMPAEQVSRAHFERGEPDRNGWFGARIEGSTLVQALADVEHGKNWVILKGIHRDPVYGALLAAFLEEISTLTGTDLAENFRELAMTVFVTSPGRITPYHMDGETNFLAQVRGTKDVFLYDPTRDGVLSAEALERYWTGTLPKIDLPGILPNGHWHCRLEPGTGVLNPATFPHWLRNGPDVSVSVSINFRRRDDVAVGAHRTNRYLRRLGFSPSPVGSRPGLDRAKATSFGQLYAFADRAAKLLKRLR